MDLAAGVRDRPAPDRLRGRRRPRRRRLVHPRGPARPADRRRRPRRGGADRPVRRRRSTRGSMRPGSPATSAAEEVWAEPIYRDVWGLLDEFGDAEVASLVVPRALLWSSLGGPGGRGPAAGRSAAGRWPPRAADRRRPRDGVVAEFDRLARLTEGLDGRSFTIRPVGRRRAPTPTTSSTARSGPRTSLLGLPGCRRRRRAPVPETTWTRPARCPTPSPGMGRWVRALEGHTQALIRTSELRRYDYWSKADTSSPEAWAASTPPYREAFRDEVIGTLPARHRAARSRGRSRSSTSRSSRDTPSRCRSGRTWSPRASCCCRRT